VLTLSGVDSLTNYQQVLRTLKYSNSSQNPSTTARLVQVTVNDGTSNSTARTSTVTVVGVNDAPDLASIADQNATIGVLFELTVTATDPEGDELTYQLDRTGVNTPASATITKINNNAAVIRWTPTAADTEEEYTFVVLVTEETGQALTDQETFIVSITTAPPAVDANGPAAGIDFAANFVEDDLDNPILIVDPGLTVTDFDSENLSSAAVTITNLLDGADEVLSVQTAGTDITASYDSEEGVLSLTGSDTLANYQQVLRTLRYDNASQDPTEVARVITIVVSDGENNSAPATLTVNVAGVNDPVNLVLPAPYNSGTPVEVTQGSPIEFTAEIIDPDHTLDEVTFQLLLIGGSIPDGAAQPDVSTTGVFTWTPDTVGTFRFRIIVTEALGEENRADQETFTITVVAEEETEAESATSGDSLVNSAIDAALEDL
jgi:hypothetical protein